MLRWRFYCIWFETEVVPVTSGLAIPPRETLSCCYELGWCCVVLGTKTIYMCNVNNHRVLLSLSKNMQKSFNEFEAAVLNNKYCMIICWSRWKIQSTLYRDSSEYGQLYMMKRIQHEHLYLRTDQLSLRNQNSHLYFYNKDTSMTWTPYC